VLQLVSDLPGSLKRLLNAGGGDFWCTGRFLVQVERYSVFVVDGEYHVGLIAKLQ
jgi:hypothetical protein